MGDGKGKETYPNPNCPIFRARIHLMRISAEDQPGHCISVVRKHPQRLQGGIPNHNSLVVTTRDDVFSIVTRCDT